MRVKCGYQPCSCFGTHFISRGFRVNDYCVEGHRVSVSDAGVWRNATEAQKESVRLFELERYVDYIEFHVEHKAKYDQWPELSPFSFITAFPGMNETEECSIYQEVQS